jgi:hypothetical protein
MSRERRLNKEIYMRISFLYKKKDAALGKAGNKMSGYREKLGAPPSGLPFLVIFFFKPIERLKNGCTSPQHRTRVSHTTPAMPAGKPSRKPENEAYKEFAAPHTQFCDQTTFS